MQRVIGPFVVVNDLDPHHLRMGLIQPDQVRRIEFEQVDVATDTTFLGLPRSLIRRLALFPSDGVGARRTSDAGRRTSWLSARLSFGDRNCPCSVRELPEGATPIIGQLILEWLGLVIEPETHRVIPNPANGGQWILEAYGPWDIE